MFRRILIANRGEVAARVLRTCRRLGVAAVGVTTDPDRDLSYLNDFDAVVHLGGPRSYLDMDALLAAAEAEACSAVHPGWGFLSENATFAARCEANRLTFIGPRPLSMRQMGDKSEARRTMARLGVAPIPGSDGPLDAPGAARLAESMGYPVLLKALAGGGGRGMRRVYRAGDLSDAFQAATAEGEGAFGNGALYMEKLIESGRHVELQVVGDGRGEVVVLGARECSVQRRHQKLLEEAPPPATASSALEAVSARAIDALRALRYRGAGTVEMLQDSDGTIWFMEMNTRLQVEHTVTEEVTGLDLVEVQLRVAAGQALGAALSAARRPGGAPGGHALQCRINAEDPSQGFRPRPGLVTALRLPVGPQFPGVRIDTHLREGDRISPHYDSMIAKVITHGATRGEAIDRMRGALGALVVEGVPTTVPAHLRVLDDRDFLAGRYDTTFLNRFPDLAGLAEKSA